VGVLCSGNFAVQGFEDLAKEDQYRCPEGHRRISGIMFLAATLVCALCLLLWAGKPGTGLLIAQVVSVDFLIHEIRAILGSPVPAVRKAGPVVP
jgi:hypothetical protein